MANVLFLHDICLHDIAWNVLDYSEAELKLLSPRVQRALWELVSVSLEQFVILSSISSKTFLQAQLVGQLLVSLWPWIRAYYPMLWP